MISKPLLEFLEGILLGFLPDERCVLRRKRRKWCRDSRVVRNEPSVEIGKPKEGLYLLNVSWGWLLLNNVHLLSVYLDSIPGYYVA